MVYHYSPEQAAHALPIWLREELTWSNAKYQTDNPQLSALWGGLRRNNPAYMDFVRYYARFVVFYTQSEGNEQALLRAQQAVGKFVGVGRALLQATIEMDEGLKPGGGIDPSINWLSSNLRTLGYRNLSTADFDAIWDQYFESSIEATANALNIMDVPRARRSAETLLLRQAQLFVDATCTTQLLATPGFSSTDEMGTVAVWRPQ